MGHADDDFLHALLRGLGDGRFERGDDALRPFEREALGAGIFHVEEALEPLRLVQMAQDLRLLAGRERLPVALAFHHPLHPGLPLRVLDVHELDAHTRAIGLLEDRQHLAQRGALEPEHAVDIDRPVVVHLGEAIALGIELRVMPLAVEAEGVEGGDEMAAHPVGADHHEGTDRIDGLRLDRGVRIDTGRGRSRRRAGLRQPHRPVLLRGRLHRSLYRAVAAPEALFFLENAAPARIDGGGVLQYCA